MAAALLSLLLVSLSLCLFLWTRTASASALHPIRPRDEESFLKLGHHEQSADVDDMTAKLDDLRRRRKWKKWDLNNPGARAGLDKLLEMSYKDNKFRPKRPPNILFMLADDLGYGDLSVMPFVTKYSSSWPCDEGGILTPNLEKMAKRGLIMTNFHSAAPVCSPSRVSFMTGVASWRLGALNAFELGQDL